MQMTVSSLQQNTSLKCLNTFGIDAKARYFIVIQTPEELYSILSNQMVTDIPKLILGDGSNILFTQNYDGLIIKNAIKGIELISEDDNHVWLKIGGGENWHDFVMYCIRQGYGGIESYADGLLVLREDLRDPMLRARGAAWKASLSKILADCFAEMSGPPQDVGLLMASHWQGSLLWWSFDPTIDVAAYVEDSLNRFVAAVTAAARKP